MSSANLSGLGVDAVSGLQTWLEQKLFWQNPPWFLTRLIEVPA
jgi:hypothetical protein